MIAAILLAAGESKRMGTPKMLLPWGNRTVIEHVVSTFLKAGIEEILVVTGGAREQVEQALETYPVRKLHNPKYATGEMLLSLQRGIRAMPERTEAVLIGLGDQPQVQEQSLRAICDTDRETASTLIVPSFRRKRGHPWLVARPLWDELLMLRPHQTPRDFLNHHADQIQYLNLDTPTILTDLDTREDYEKSRP
jgi:molybdenum cofactor cytidylyltransferase